MSESEIKYVPVRLSRGEYMVTPNSEPEYEFLSSAEYEVLYGGAAGGGKTWCLVAESLKYKDYPRYTAIIFRRTYPQLMGSVFPIASEMYQAAGATWYEQKKQFVFPSGATVRLGYMQYIDDWENYQGHEYARHLYDELGQFYEDQYVKLAPWCRSKVDGIPPRRRASANPGGIGHLWIKKRMIDTCRPEIAGPKRWSELAKVFWQPMKPGPTYYARLKYPDGTIKFQTRRFIPSRVFDNIDMLKRNPEYVTNLLVLPERMRRALLEGDWDAFAGQFFPFNSDSQLVKPFLIPKAWPLIGALDPGWGGFTSYSLSTTDFSGNYYRIATYYDNEKNIIKNVKAIYKFTRSLDLTRGRMPDYVISDPAAWAKRDQYAITEDLRTFADFMEQAGFNMFKGLNDRLTGWANMVTMMEQKDLITNVPKYMVFANYNEPYIEQLVAAVSDEKVPGDLEGRGKDAKLAYHCLDEERYKLMAISFPESIDRPKTELEKAVDDEIESTEDKHTVMGV